MNSMKDGGVPQDKYMVQVFNRGIPSFKSTGLFRAEPNLMLCAVLVIKTPDAQSQSEENKNKV